MTESAVTPAVPPAQTRRRLRGVAAVLTTAAACGALVTLAPTAEAAGYAVAYTGGDVWADGRPVTIVCQTWSADGVGPRANHVFDRVAYPARSEPTWIPDAYVAGTAAANQFTPGIARCGDPAPTPAPPTTGGAVSEQAIHWMATQLGSRRYDELCLEAVYRAYLSGGRDITAGLPYGPSHDSAFSYWSVSRDRHPGDRAAPRGALVFFRSAAGGPGHVALSLGGGNMISTWDGRTPGIHIMAISAYDPARYLGWTTA